MGNKIGRKRQVIDERYTKPQGLYPSKEIDHKKLRKLILEYKLAPCYAGEEEYAYDLEECPICFLYYPSLNRSRCCMKSICTECFLQMKPPQATRPTQCPFCKTANYAVEYRGVKTKEEKGLEQVEEQKVIEAKIRIRQKELQDETERTNKMHDSSSSSITMTLGELDHFNLSSTSFSVPYSKCMRQKNGHVSAEASCSTLTSTRPSHSRQIRDDNFDLDLEDIMVMEAIWLSIQEEANRGNPVCYGSQFAGPSSEEYYNSQAMVPIKVSPSGRLACAAAALAERQHMNGETAGIALSTNASAFEMLHQPSDMLAANLRFVQNSPSGQWIAAPQGDGRELMREEYGEGSTDQWSEAAEAGTSYAGSDIMLDAGVAPVSFPDGANMVPGQYAPESFEEQMMLAMAVSLAEARGRFGSPGLSWL